MIARKRLLTGLMLLGVLKLVAQEPPALLLYPGYFQGNEISVMQWARTDTPWQAQFTRDIQNPDWQPVMRANVFEFNTEQTLAVIDYHDDDAMVFYRLVDLTEPIATYFNQLAQNPDILITDSGLHYEILRVGDGNSPGPLDAVRVDYEGQLTDSTIFDSSYQRGTDATFNVGGVIPGFAEGLQLMREGGAIRIYLPWQLAYGHTGTGSIIAPYATLVFDIELYEVIPAEPSALSLTFSMAVIGESPTGTAVVLTDPSSTQPVHTNLTFHRPPPTPDAAQSPFPEPEVPME